MSSVLYSVGFIYDGFFQLQLLYVSYTGGGSSGGGHGSGGHVGDCSTGQVQCGNGQCIPDHWWCDNFDDCDDDETQCTGNDVDNERFIYIINKSF